MSDQMTQLGANFLGGLGAVPASETAPVGALENLEGEPIALSGDDLTRFKVRFRNELDRAKDRPVTNEAIRRWRGFYAQDPYRVVTGDDEELDEMPNYTLPVIRRKVNGMTAFAKRQLNRDPFFSGRAYSDSARSALPAFEIVMERNLDIVKGKRQIFRAIKDAALVTTCFIGVAPDIVDGEVVTPLKAYRLENFYVSPGGVESLAQASTFVHSVEPMFMVKAKAGPGPNGEAPMYDPEAVAMLQPATQAQTVPDHVIPRDSDISNNPIDPESDNALVKIWESYYRFEGKLWRVFYAESGAAEQFLHIRPSWTEGIINKPPYQEIRIETQIDQIMGNSISQVAEGMQQVTDFAFNSYLSHMLLAINPWVFADEASDFYRENHGQGLRAGKVYGTRGKPDQSVEVVRIPTSNAPIELMNVGQDIVDGATFPDQAFIGQPLRSVRSATEVSGLNDAAHALSADYMEQLTDDLSALAEMIWAILYHYKFSVEKVSPVVRGDDSYLIAQSEISAEEYAERFAEFAMQRQQVPPEQAVAMAQELYQSGKYIPGVERNDFEWMCNGSELVPDKLARAGKIRELFEIMPLIMQAPQSRALWNLLKMYMEDLDIQNWRKILGKEPEVEEMEPEKLLQASEMVRNMRQGSAPRR